MLEVTSLKEQHLPDAALLVSNRYRKLLEQEPSLPKRYAAAAEYLPLLQGILSRSGVGVAAHREGRLVGFLTAWKMSSFRGKRSIYSPEWANAADLDDSRRIYEEMYTRVADTWVAEKYIAHYLSLFPNDVAALRAWNWLGFGMISVDGIRGMESISCGDVDAQIRRAEPQDIELVFELHEALRQYMIESPTFLPVEVRDKAYFEEWLQDPGKAVWLAFRNGEPVAMMRLGPADQEVCKIIDDEKTTSVYSAFTRKEVRGKGIATALLSHALQAARASGYERCAVPFEPMNLLGSRMWLRYFRPVCFSVFRHVDERIIQE